jgi:hypothetical protein
MKEEIIEYCLKQFKKNKHGFRFENGLQISLYEVFKQLKAKEEMVKIMEKYFELIIDLGFDYDGFNKADSLKSLIDELVRFAKLGRACNTTEPIYVNNENVYNILHEEILSKGENK